GQSSRQPSSGPRAEPEPGSGGLPEGVEYIPTRKKGKNPMKPVGVAWYRGGGRTRLGYLFYQRQVKKARGGGPHGHSAPQPCRFPGVKILPIPVLSNNYSYLVIDTGSGRAAVVDPSDPLAVQAAIEEEGVMLEGGGGTHKHWDHSGGGGALRQQHSSCKVYGSALDAIPELTNPLVDREKVSVGCLGGGALATPGHTVGHMVYVLDGGGGGGPPCLFSGDLLFLAGWGGGAQPQIWVAGGGGPTLGRGGGDPPIPTHDRQLCGGPGRRGGGSPETMLASLDVAVGLGEGGGLWPGVRGSGGGEYALECLTFASLLELDNGGGEQKLQWATQQRQEKRSTGGGGGSPGCSPPTPTPQGCPSTLGEEQTYNPFGGGDQPELQAALGLRRGGGERGGGFRARVLKEVRRRKDLYKGG
ncbi:PNKD hydrolase, partial [Oceanites oceanicus]|nr:PNKD hydrolase [Oceanites oceanicus]